jgi:putative two-component system response regulator
MSAPASTQDSGDVLRSRAFALESLRSERSRIALTIAALAAVVVIVVVRDLLVGGPGLARRMMLLAGIAGGAILYEAALLALVQARIGRGEPVPTATWWLNAMIEALFPAFVLVVATLIETPGPHRALVSPAVSLYYVAIVLSTLRLRPPLCYLSGAVSAASYLGVVAWTFRVYPEGAPGMEPLHPAIHATIAAMMLVSGLVAGGVARQIRRHVAAALREARERQRLEVRARNTLIFGLAKLAEYRDADTGAHLERISEYAAVLAEAMRERHPEIAEEWIETIRVASSMHDIGKVGIPDGVLLKPGRLTEDERRVIERHPGIGADALRAIQERHGEDALLLMSAQIAIGHHERWDGTGYPNRTRGEETGLAARIIAVADVYDALTSARVYKKALSHDEACRIIREGRGTQFDPEVVDAFETIARRFHAIRGRYAG